MSLEDRIRKLADEILTCEDGSRTALLAEELQDAIRDRVIHQAWSDVSLAVQ